MSSDAPEPRSNGAAPPTEEPWFGLVRALVHDLRTPIATAAGYLELVELDSGSLDAGQTEYLERAAIALREVSSLTSTLLEIARLDAGQRTLRRAEHQCSALVSRLLSRRRPLERRSIERGAGGDDPAIRLRCDGELVERALDAMLDFSLSRSPDGERVSISVERRGDVVRLAVSDLGTPLDDARLAQLYTHRRPSLEAAARLALVYCRLAAAAHDGTAGAERPPEGGMRFWIEIPDVDDPASTTG